MPSPHAVFGETQSSQSSSPSIPSSTTALPTSTIPIKRKRIRFNKTLDYLLLQSVSAAGAHAAPYGEAGKRYERAAVVFWESMAEKTRADTLPPTAKTIRDRFTTVMDQRRKGIKATSAASVIVEEREAREALADDLLLEIDEWIEKKKEKDRVQGDKERELTDARAKIREQALHRCREKTKQAAIDLDGSLSSAPSSTLKLRKRRSFVVQNSEEDERESFKGISERDERENKRLKMEEETLRREDRKFLKDQLDERRLALEERRVSLEEKKYEMQAEDRKLALQERKVMVDLLATLTKKLQSDPPK